MQATGAGLIATSSRTAPTVSVHRPTSCGEVLRALATEKHPPTLVGGGTDLCAQYNEGLEPSALVALDRVRELRDIRLSQGFLCIGSAVTHDAGCRDQLVRAHLPGFADAWAKIANVRVRFWATIGGNVMARRTRYEMSLLLTALDAKLVFLGSDGAMSELTPAEVWDGYAPARGLLHHVAVPIRGRLRFVYDRSLRPVATLALRVDESGAMAAIATARLRPCALPVTGDTFASLPDDFEDATTSNWYLRRAGAALLTRALAKAAADV